MAFDLGVPVMITYNIYSHIKSTQMECNIQDMRCALRRARWVCRLAPAQVGARYPLDLSEPLNPSWLSDTVN